MTTPLEWAQTALDALRDLEAVVQTPEDHLLPSADDLVFPSLSTLIDQEVTKPLEEVRELTEIRPRGSSF